MIRMQVDRRDDAPTKINSRKDPSKWTEIDSIGPIVDAIYDARTTFVIVQYKNWDLCFDPTVSENDPDMCCLAFIYDIPDRDDRGDDDPAEFFEAMTAEEVPDLVRDVFTFAIAVTNQKISHLQEDIRTIDKFCK